MHSRLWLSDARGEPSPRAGSHYLEFFYALKFSAVAKPSYSYLMFTHSGGKLSRDRRT